MEVEAMAEEEVKAEVNVMKGGVVGKVRLQQEKFHL